MTGIFVLRLEDTEQYKNAFEICGPMIEKRICVCQSKEEANNWVELLRKHMPRQSTTSNYNQRLPSQAEIVPQPPPHVSVIKIFLNNIFSAVFHILDMGPFQAL